MCRNERVQCAAPYLDPSIDADHLKATRMYKPPCVRDAEIK